MVLKASINFINLAMYDKNTLGFFKQEKFYKNMWLNFDKNLRHFLEQN